MKDYSTKEISEELEKREGVSTIFIEPHSNAIITTYQEEINIEGPAIILIKQD
nr:BC1881 family protein [Seinonella peptonophila]